MSLSKYSKRRGQFEALEAKQLFAADLVGGAAAGLPDTVVVAENARTIMGGIKTSEESVVAAGTNQSGLVNNIGIPTDGIGWVSVENLGIRGTELCIGGSNATMTAVAGSSEDGSVPTESVSFNFDDVPHRSDSFNRYLPPDTGNPLHTAAHEAAHVTHQLGGQEGEPIIEDIGLEASIAPDGCVDLIAGTAIDSPESPVVTEVDTGVSSGHSLTPTEHKVNSAYDFTISPNYVGGGQEGEPIVDPADCPQLVDHVFQDYTRNDFQITDQHYFAVR